MEIVGDPSRLARALAELSGQFAEALPGRLAEVEAEVESLVRRPEDRESLERMRARVHKLAGSGKTFGFAALSREALDLEHLLKRLASRQEPPSLVEVDALRRSFLLMKEAAEERAL